MNRIRVECDYCQKVFDRPSNRYTEAVNNNWRQYCSPECQRMSKVKHRISTPCTTCGRNLQRLESMIEPSGNVFCSHHCSAQYTNTHRTTRLMIARKAKQLAMPICINPDCQKRIRIANKHFCSPACRVRYAKIESQKYIIEKIQQFVKTHERIPVKYEVVKAYSRARVGFGTWNKAIIAAGFDPNPVMFAKQQVARDGHRCDSMAEKIVDDWLDRKGFAHQINVPYPWNNGMTADFVVGSTWIEIFGLSGEHKRYDELKQKKLKLAKEADITILALSLKDVYGGKLATKLACLS